MLKKKIETITMTKPEAENLRLFATWGNDYRDYLRSEIRRIGKLIGEETLMQFAVDVVDDVPKLKALHAEMCRRWDLKLPPRSQGRQDTSDMSGLNPAVAKMFTGLGVTPEDVEKAKHRNNGNS